MNFRRRGCARIQTGLGLDPKIETSGVGEKVKKIDQGSQFVMKESDWLSVY